jgi:translation initiation factor 2 alpha subunit (eIF-2alpha)
VTSRVGCLQDAEQQLDSLVNRFGNLTNALPEAHKDGQKLLKRTQLPEEPLR